MKRCPSCGRGIQEAASKCHYCGTVVRQPRVVNEAEPPHARTAAPARPRIFTLTIAIPLIVLVALLAWLML